MEAACDSRLSPGLCSSTRASHASSSVHTLRDTGVGLMIQVFRASGRLRQKPQNHKAYRDNHTTVLISSVLRNKMRGNSVAWCHYFVMTQALIGCTSAFMHSPQFGSQCSSKVKVLSSYMSASQLNLGSIIFARAGVLKGGNGFMDRRALSVIRMSSVQNAPQGTWIKHQKEKEKDEH